MKFIQFFALTILLSCNYVQETEKTIAKSSKTKISEPTKSIINGPNEDTSKTEIINTFIDSLNIGEKGKYKIELIKHRVYEDKFIIIKFYVKWESKWYIQNTFSYETNSLMDFQPEFSDFNNDKFNDITFISETAARGANEVRRLFIYDDQNQELLSIVNSEDYPNMRYNKELNCIDAFLVHGGSTTEFARIIGDSLKTFASVDNNIDYHTVCIVDKKGNHKELYKVKSKGVYVRHQNFNPLIEYKNE